MATPPDLAAEPVDQHQTDHADPIDPGDPAGAPGADQLELRSDGEEVAPGGVLPGRSTGFEVRLDNFEGPFDLLLGLISKHRLDVTEIAIAQVTDDFMAHIRALGDTWDLGEVSEFLLVAATLLDLKAARLLPVAEVEDDEDLALLEARDLLFARLLQYRAFKDVAATFAGRIATENRYCARDVPLEPQFLAALPELVLNLSPLQFAELAARALTPKVPPTVALEHLHAPQVSVREQAALIVDRMRRGQTVTFRSLVADAGGETIVVVARFLALLELFREGAVGFDQVAPLGELTVRWTGADEGEYTVDEFEGAPVDAENAPDAAAESPAEPASGPASETADPATGTVTGTAPGTASGTAIETGAETQAGTGAPADKAE